jgi:hypothetical protein
MTTKLLFEVVVLIKFLASNWCFLSSYLLCIYLLKRQCSTNPAILIGEQQNLGQKRQNLLRMRTLLVGNVLGLTAYAALLAVTIPPGPLQQKRWRALELQLHVLVMHYYANSMRLAGFLRRRIEQFLQPLELQWKRKSAKITPLP